MLIEVIVRNIVFYPPARGYTLLLKPKGRSNRHLPIIVGQNEAQAIAMALEGLKAPRPMTHDLLTNVIRTLSELDSVVVNDLRDGTFYAKLRVGKPDELLEIDSRPSDAVAVALRYHRPIFVEDWILQEAGVSIKAETEKGVDLDPDLNEDLSEISAEARERLRLEAELKEAVEREDYERAAQIRDRLRSLES